ncbi:hypothetical protein GCM10011322_38370 [Salinarimonas ramus]|uniref:Uncharacterized protein n=1 Tax=Salinarimonas ramus TaxID=690164 RepID=A0A917QEZ8_9HYPH|nr:hypothetical protein GCM10011322_38370 [Salinarimonas ramus]
MLSSAIDALPKASGWWGANLDAVADDQHTHVASAWGDSEHAAVEGYARGGKMLDGLPTSRTALARQRAPGTFHCGRVSAAKIFG